MQEALTAMQSDSSVQVTKDGWITFMPAGGEPDTGVIFYPGGRVDHRAYAPLMSELAANGYLVSLVPMPFNLAVFGSESASQVIAAHPEIEHWVIGGHSLGGAMAASFVFNESRGGGWIILSCGLSSWQSKPGGFSREGPLHLRDKGRFG